MSLRLFTITALGTGLILAGCTNTATGPTGASPTDIGAIESTPTPPGSPQPNVGAATVTVSAQKPGRTVTVASVTLDKPGFVMIHLVDAQGNPGAAIGNSAIFTGSKTNLVIDLTQASKNGENLIAMVHYDINNDKKAEFPGPDIPAIDSQGNIIMTEFTVGTAASPTGTAKPSATP